MWKYSKYRKPIVLILDMLILVLCSLFVFILSPKGNGVGRDIVSALPDMLLLYGCIFIAQIVFKSYNTLWRYAESREYLVLMCGAISGTLLFTILTDTVLTRKVSHLYVFTTVTMSIVIVMLVRFMYRAYRRSVLSKTRKTKRRVVIVGAGGAGVALYKEISTNHDSPYSLAFFVDDDPYKINCRINGAEIKGPISSLPEIIGNQKAYIDEIIIAIPSISNTRKKEIVDICNKTDIHVKILPGTLDIIMGDGNKELLSRVRNVSIEDLLGRDQVMLDVAGVNFLIREKTILVTGGGGSIGSELCRQIASIGPERLVIVDIYENNAYEIQQELLSTYHKKINIFVEIASVRDEQRLNAVFEKYKPDVVFHAAAHKHVPLMESCPGEAIKNNVFGTWNTIRAAEKCGVSRFVLISTDKAVNPTNVMGATKRVCEMMLQTMRDSECEFIAVRFGNVLGSNGSVIPLFKKQIENGGPITITDKRIIRYFMTIPEAAQLVLQAGAMAKKSEVFVLDMGEPVKILSLAENLITLSGLKPYEDIKIVEVGLRPGEKLYEELLVKSDELIKTANQKIFIEKQEPISREWMEASIARLKVAIDNGDSAEIVEILHEIVPTFKDPNKVNSEAVAKGEL
ncbi:MAG: polysaccharide biosynthesis protein [Clostridia bacterium]|nr:polysaccharide biosynthesis protein [Clostridia bacterium]